MNSVTMIYWKGKKFWLGKLKEHPEIMTQGRTIKELEANLRDAYRFGSIWALVALSNRTPSSRTRLTDKPMPR